MNQWGFRCFHCDRPLAIASHGFCRQCVKQLPTSPYCGHCGMPLRENALSCGECLRNEPKWHRMVRICDYKKPIITWIHRFKFQDQFWFDEALARLLFLAIREAKRTHGLTLPEVILPVPLYWQRHWKRSYNQASMLAKPLSQWLNLPLDTQSLQRLRATASQRELTATQRRRNLKGAFRFSPPKPYKRVAIVDDVVTTGSTLNAICAELLKNGVEEIQVWALARA